MAAKKRRRKTKFEEFQGFPTKGLTFLRNLAKNNDRDWFQANKDRYLEHVKGPLEAFLADVEEEFGPGKVFRIYRDVRFSKDKSPYKTHASVVFENEGCVFYFHIEAKQIFAATGYYQMAKDQRKRFYDAVIDDKAGKKLAKLVDAAEANDLEIGGEALKTAARGYPKDHARVRFLRHKGLTTSRTWKKASWWHTAELGERVVETFRDSQKLNEWLITHVGASQEGRRFVKG